MRRKSWRKINIGEEEQEEESYNEDEVENVGLQDVKLKGHNRIGPTDIQIFIKVLS